MAALVAGHACFAPSVAAGPTQVSVHSDSECPTAELVARELQGSLPRTEVLVHPAPANEVVNIVNGGDHYSIAVKGEERTVDDPARDCDERARVVAIFAAMALEPPVIEAASVKSIPPQPTLHRQASAAPRDVPPKRAVAEAGAEVETPAAWFSFGVLTSWAGSSSQPFALGPEVGLGVGSGLLMLQTSLAVTTPSTLRFRDAQVDLVRLPANVSAYVRAPKSDLETAVGVGVAVEGLHIAARGEFTPHSHTLLQWGARASARGRLLLNRGFAIFCELTGTFVPSSYDLAVVPDGVIGSTPAVWLGLTLGGTMGLL